VSQLTPTHASSTDTNARSLNWQQQTPRSTDNRRPRATVVAQGSWLEALVTQEPGGGPVVAQPLHNLSQRLPIGGLATTRALCYS
jgi:hypothetical protein